MERKFFIIYVIISLFLEECLKECDGNIMEMIPNPQALVKEGETLHLQCNYTGSFKPDFINWYVNGDHNGLVINASTCKIYTKPERFKLYILKESCNGNQFKLYIVNISKTRDNGSKWECDTTKFGMHPPTKASTTIQVIEPVHKGNEGLSTGSIIVIVGSGIVLLMVLAIALCKVSKIRKNGDRRKNATQEVRELMQMTPFNHPVQECNQKSHSDVMETVAQRQDS